MGAAEIEREREANLFAMALLMPEKLVREWIAKFGGNGPDFTDDDWLKRLAKDFAVSHTLAALRLQQLGIFRV